MARITLRQLLDHAAEHDYGLPAFNINNMEQGLAIMEAAEAVDAPVIIQASRGARSYANDIMLARLIDALVEIYPAIPVCMHQDHGNSPATCATAIQYGFTSVMMDGSLKADGKSPADYAYNVAVTRQTVDMAHACGVSVEGELGVLGSLETGMGEKEDGHGFEGKLDHSQLLTDPDEAVAFVQATGVDALAIAMGTSHGAYKFTRKPDGDVLAMGVIEEIHRRLPNTHLVMHGSSSVPQELQDEINAHGGQMPQTWGVPVEEIQRGIRHGVRKINIDTDNRMAITAAIRKVFASKPGEFDPRAYLKPAKEAMRAVCKQRFQEFGAEGWASKIRPLHTSAMARRYACGDLDPKIGAARLRRSPPSRLDPAGAARTYAAMSAALTAEDVKQLVIEASRELDQPVDLRDAEVVEGEDPILHDATWDIRVSVVRPPDRRAWVETLGRWGRIVIDGLMARGDERYPFFEVLTPEEWAQRRV